ncbi:MAG TPA: C4-dicarboxylate transporter DctA [Vicinamibacterales bacterium]|nr:C4-dicarboxylate transporter DctA [Vicinamibacterales bacterium]
MAAKKPWYAQLYVQVLIAMGIGALVGHFAPGAGRSLKPLGDGFIALIRMVIGPIIFCNVVAGIASMRDMKKLGRVGLKTLVYFEVVATLALVVGVAAALVIRPGAGFNLDPATLDSTALPPAATAPHQGTLDFILGIIPETFFGAFASAEILPVLLVSILSGFAVGRMGAHYETAVHAVETAARFFFSIIHIITRAAPVAALGAIAFTVGAYGLSALWNLIELIMTFYLTAAVFVFVVLNVIARLAGFSIFRFVGYIKDELLIVLGTSSSETALPHMLEKLERLGAAKSTVGLVFPTGYSFNTDGSNIYITLSALFLAQATNTHMPLGDVLGLVLFAAVTSKGASGVSGTAFITLAVTLSAFPAIPIESLAVLLGIDKFMSECRAVTNVIGNGVATLVVSRWERELDVETLRRNLRSGPEPTTREALIET